MVQIAMLARRIHPCVRCCSQVNSPYRLSVAIVVVWQIVCGSLFPLYTSTSLPSTTARHLLSFFKYHPSSRHLLVAVIAVLYLRSLGSPPAQITPFLRMARTYLSLAVLLVIGTSSVFASSCKVTSQTYSAQDGTVLTHIAHIISFTAECPANGN